jgi:glycosyltransferase involved in cell wall biosynthesis
MHEQLVSIALCTFNGERYIKEQLNSILEQTYTNLEILILDDCSTDNTVQIIKESYSDTRIKIIVNEKNLGFIKNFEKAIELCSGEFIALADQDDIWEREKISILLNEIDNNLMIYSDSIHIDDEGNLLKTKNSDLRKFYEGTDYKPLIFFNCVSGHSILFKKELKEYILPLPDYIYHDWWIAYNGALFGGITFSQKKLVKYRQHINSDNYSKISKIKTRKISNKVRMEKVILWLNFLKIHHQKFGKETKFIEDLTEAYTTKMKYIWSYRLFRIFSKNSEYIFFIHKRNKFKKFKMILNDSLIFNKINTFNLPLFK